MSGNKSTKIAFNYFGGKFTWIKHLYRCFPDNFTHLIDLFAGSMVVSINYPGKVIKTANEINSEITNFFEVLRDHEGDLIRLLLLTPCSKQEYDNCWQSAEDKIEQARRFYVRVRQSFFGFGCQRQNKGWHMAKQHVNARGGETVSRWNNAIAKLHEVADVLRSGFQITNLDYADCINKIDFPGAFFYCDPPYPSQCRNSRNDYVYEFSDEQHADLANKLHGIQGRAMISSYDCPLMNELYGDWEKVKFPIKKNNIRSGIVNGSGTLMQEVVWMNYTPNQEIQKLF